MPPHDSRGNKPAACFRLIVYAIGPAWVAAATSLSCGVDGAAATRPSAPDAEVDRLVGAANGADYRAKLDAVIALGRLSGRDEVDEAIPTLLHALRDDDWYVRLQAVVSLYSVAPTDPRVWPALNSMAGDKVIRVRDAALRESRRAIERRAVARREGDELEWTGRQWSAETARRAEAEAAESGRSIPPSARRRAAEAQAGQPSDPAAERVARLIDHLLDDPNEPRVPWNNPIDLRGAVGEAALRALGPDAWRALPMLCAAFRDPDPARADRAAALLGRFGPAAAPVFVAALQEKNTPAVVRLRALEGLASMKDEAAVAAPAVYAVLLHPEGPDELGRALRIAERIGPGRTDAALLDALLKLINDPGNPLAGQALRTLAALDPWATPLTPAIVAALHDGKHPAHGAALDVAGWLGADPVIREAVLRLLKDPDAGVRARASVALVTADPGAVRTADALVRAVRDNDYVVRSILAPGVRRGARPGGLDHADAR